MSSPRGPSYGNLSAHDALSAVLVKLGSPPPPSATASEKKAFSEKMSAAVAIEVAHQLRLRGLKDCRPAPPGDVGKSGAERQMAGGLGPKRVDVSWATEDSGLLLAVSVKTINAKDGRSGNYGKNLTNRRSDLVIDAMTLHKRFPYAVVAGLFIFDEGAQADDTKRRKSTFENAHRATRIFTGRADHIGADEKFERLYIGLQGQSTGVPRLEFYPAGRRDEQKTLDEILLQLLHLIEERNPDFYEVEGGKLSRR